MILLQGGREHWKVNLMVSKVLKTLILTGREDTVECKLFYYPKFYHSVLSFSGYKLWVLISKLDWVVQSISIQTTGNKSDDSCREGGDIGLEINRYPKFYHSILFFTA